MSPVEGQPTASAGWFGDPFGRFSHRYWDAIAWTCRLRTATGETSDNPGERLSEGPSCLRRVPGWLYRSPPNDSAFATGPTPDAESDGNGGGRRCRSPSSQHRSPSRSQHCTPRPAQSSVVSPEGSSAANVTGPSNASNSSLGSPAPTTNPAVRPTPSSSRARQLKVADQYVVTWSARISGAADPGSKGGRPDVRRPHPKDPSGPLRRAVGDNCGAHHVDARARGLGLRGEPGCIRRRSH